MSEYDNTNKGAIWKNEKRETDKHPHFKGNANIDGVEYWVSAWKRDENAKPKSPALKFSFERKDETHAKGMESAKAAADPLDSEEIPF